MAEKEKLSLSKAGDKPAAGPAATPPVAPGSAEATPPVAQGSVDATPVDNVERVGGIVVAPGSSVSYGRRKSYGPGEEVPFKAEEIDEVDALLKRGVLVERADYAEALRRAEGGTKREGDGSIRRHDGPNFGGQTEGPKVLPQ